MHPNDVTCRWCRFSPMYVSVDGVICGVDHICRQKPPLTPDEGAAVAFGLMGMAEAIRFRSLITDRTFLVPDDSPNFVPQTVVDLKARDFARYCGWCALGDCPRHPSDDEASNARQENDPPTTNPERK